MLKLARGLASLWSKRAGQQPEEGSLVGLQPRRRGEPTRTSPGCQAAARAAARSCREVSEEPAWPAPLACFSQNTCVACFPHPRAAEQGLRQK